jgi:hypothetical protein
LPFGRSGWTAWRVTTMSRHPLCRTRHRHLQQESAK